MKSRLFNQQGMSFLLGGLLVVWPPLLVVHDHARLVVMYLLGLLGLIVLARKRLERGDQVALILLVVIVAAYLTGLLAWLASGYPAKGWPVFKTIYDPFFYIFPIFFLFRYYRPPLATLWWGGVAGCFMIGYVTLAQLHEAFAGWAWVLSPSILANSEFRVYGTSFSTLFGMLSASFALLAIGGFSYFRRRSFTFLLWAVAVALALFSCVMTGTRIAWIGLLVAWALAFTLNSWRLPKPFQLGLLVIGVAGLLLAANLQIVQSRFSQAVHDVEVYKDNPNTSLGQRFEMWRAAVLIAEEHPLLGIGFDKREYAKELGQLNERNLVDPSILDYSHSHNEIMYALVTRGALGAITILILFISFPILFFRAWRSAEPSLKQLAMTGLMISTASVIYGFSDVPSLFRSTAIPYALLMGILLGLCYPAGAGREKAVSPSNDSPSNDVEPNSRVIS